MMTPGSLVMTLTGLLSLTTPATPVAPWARALRGQVGPSAPSRSGGPTGPAITVRGTTRVEMGKIERVQGGVMITLTLLDADLNEGVPNRKVTLRILRDDRSVFRTSATTSKTGKAQVFVPHRSGEYTLKLSFEGDDLYIAAKPAANPVDLSKEALSLKLTSPPAVDVAGRPFAVIVEARSHAPVPGVDVTVQLRQNGRVLLTKKGLTDASGQLRLTVDPTKIKVLGELEVMARAGAGQRFNAAATAQRLTLYSRVTITLSLSKKSVKIGGKIRVRGQVRDATGPVPGGVVRIMARNRPLAVTRTNKSGDFSRLLTLTKVPLGKVAITAEFVPRTAWRRPAKSSPVILAIHPPKPIPIAYFLAPAAATLLFLLVLLTIKKRPWDALRQRLSRRKEARRTETGGIELGRRRSLGSLFGVDHLAVTGVVLDLDRREPLPGATVYLRPADSGESDRVTEADPSGAFRLEELRPGTYNLVATAPGWIPQSLLLVIPHRGELHGMTIRLQSVRLRVMQIYASVVKFQLPDPDLVRYWTPGETTEHVLQHAPEPPPSLADLTAVTQRAYYARNVPDLDTIEEAESLAREAAEAQAEARAAAQAAARKDT